MTSTDFNGEPILILSKEEAEWLFDFIEKHRYNDVDTMILRRVRVKALEVMYG